MTNANQYYDGPAVVLSAGTWLLTGVVTLEGAGNSISIAAKLWNGTTTLAQAQALSYGGAAARDKCSVALVGIVVIASGTPTWKISCAGDGLSGKIKATTAHDSAGNFASTLSAVKLA